MKKLFLVLCAVFATVVLFGCSNDDDGSDTPEQKSVVELIASAKDGDTVLMTKGTLSDNESILIDKRITLSGGETQFDAKGATITITKAGVTVKNIKNIKELIVEESVGDGDNKGRRSRFRAFCQHESCGDECGKEKRAPCP